MNPVAAAVTIPALTFIDGAYLPPLLSERPRTDGIIVYAGGDTPNPIKPQDIKGYTEQYRYILPVWVRSNPAGRSANWDATEFYNWLKIAQAPAGSLVALDLETATDPNYAIQFFDLLKTVGHPVLDYGSQSTVFGNHNPDGWYWGADWTGYAHLSNGDVMTQYFTGRNWDISMAQRFLPFWDKTPKLGPPPPSPKPAPRPTGAPEMPTGIQVMSVTAEGWTLLWNPDDTVTSYRLRITTGGQCVRDTSFSRADGKPPVKSWTIDQMTPDHTFTCHLAAYRHGIWSAESNGPAAHTTRG